MKTQLPLFRILCGLVLVGCGGCDERRASSEDAAVNDVGNGSLRDGSPGDGSPSACTAPPGHSFDPIAGFDPPAQSATHVVTSASDEGPGSLREAIANAAPDAVIGFDPSLSGETIRLEMPIELRHGVTIDGSAALGITLDGQGETRILHFNGDAPTRLAFYGLRFVNGRASGSGGAISVNGAAIDLVIGGCTFDGNASGEGGALRAGYAKGTDIFIHDSLFVDNDGTVPSDRHGFSGGAITTIGGNLRVVRSRFENNVGPTAGALYTIHSDPRVEDSVFIANRSSGDRGSGAFFADGGGPGDHNTNYDDPANQIPGRITLVRTRFESNRGAGDDGGAVEAYAYPLDIVTFETVIFKGNRSSPGRAGAAFIHASNTVRIDRCAFVDNEATSMGGAIWADGSGSYQIENTLFSGNISGADFGGALRLNIAQDAELRIVSSTFVDNVTSDGNGALWLPGMRDVRVQNSIFSNNTFQGWAQQINFPVMDEGGNILWPHPMNDAPTLADATVVDPGLGDLEAVDGTYARAPRSGSPAIDTAVTPAPTVDQRGAPRGDTADIGAFEVAATCGR